MGLLGAPCWEALEACFMAWFGLLGGDPWGGALSRQYFHPASYRGSCGGSAGSPGQVPGSSFFDTPLERNRSGEPGSDLQTPSIWDPFSGV